MEELLEEVLEAHGGRDRWRSLTTIRARITYGGRQWSATGLDGTEQVEARVQQQHLRQVQAGTGREVIFDNAADRIAVTAGDGTVLDELEHPRSTFTGGPESLAQAAYFRAYATWLYLVGPYVFTWPGVEVREVAPGTGDDPAWRVLSVTFPPAIATHSVTQLYYFDDARLLRRMDYAPVVKGGRPVIHYTPAEDKIDGIVIPTVRRVHVRRADGTPDLTFTLFALDLSDIEAY